MSTFLNIRVTDQTARAAQDAVASGETVELRTRHGELLRGNVRSVEYIFGPDQGWFVLFEVPDDRFLSHHIPRPRRVVH